MSQFRNTADILDEILAKSGEPTNGNSSFETTALTYANKMHHSIIGGGSLFNLLVDEPWIWARSRHPITLELQPSIQGTAAFVSASTTFTFGSAPSVSLEGWHIQAKGKDTVYKITNHTAATTSAQIDSSFVDATGGSSFRAFKLDYEIVQPYVYIDNFNDKINFNESAATAFTATLTHGTYTPANLISHVCTVLSATGTATYTGSYNTVYRTFSITANATSLTFLNASGGDYRRSVFPTMGFEYLNLTGATTYSAANPINRIARMIEPFKLMVGSTNGSFIYSTDTLRMQEDYPLHLVREKVPDRFARITEDRDGAVWVRFNGYPKSLTKVTLDWIPQPLDLQDNTASTVLLPRADIDTLIHGAAAMLLFDKEDSKYDAVFGLAKAGLESMKLKNRSVLSKTGGAYGQITPRQDLNPPRQLRYGYTASED